MSERRSAPRVPAVANRARFAWDEGGRPGVTRSRILDISRSGALLEAGGRPTMPGRVWLRLLGPAKSDWIAASVIRGVGDGGVAVAFDGPCPDDLLLSATLGVSFDHLLRGSGSEASIRSGW